MKFMVDSKTRNLTFLATFLAIGFILYLTPLGAIPISGVSATISMVPVIIGGIVLGPLYGMYLGISMGVLSLLRALISPATPLDILFINPLLSVLPRAFIGVVSSYAYQLIKKILHKKAPALIIGGIAGSMTNTVLVLSVMYILYAPKLLELTGAADTKALRYVIYGIVVTNGGLEAVIAAILTCGIGLALYKGLPSGSHRL